MWSFNEVILKADLVSSFVYFFMYIAKCQFPIFPVNSHVEIQELDQTLYSGE